MDIVKKNLLSVLHDPAKLKLVLFGAIGLRFLFGLSRLISSRLRQAHYARQIAEYQKRRASKIQRLEIPDVNLPQELLNEIINADVSKLKLMLERGAVTSEQLVNIFTKRCVTIGYKMNMITEENYEQALLKARRYDQLRRESPEKCEGELFGVVMSIKDTVDLKGFPSTSKYDPEKGRNRENGRENIYSSGL